MAREQSTSIPEDVVDEAVTVREVGGQGLPTPGRVVARAVGVRPGDEGVGDPEEVRPPPVAGTARGTQTVTQDEEEVGPATEESGPPTDLEGP